MPEDRSNDFFGHLDQPAPPTPRKLNRPQAQPEADYEVVPDQPPRQAPSRTPTGQQRKPTGQGPGLSPGIPKVGQSSKPTRPISAAGVVLTPGGVKRVDPSGPQDRPKTTSKLTPAAGPAQAQPSQQTGEYFEASRQKNDTDDVSWEEYAASDFPAMAAEEFGVKTRVSDSGRVVPVAVRADLTEEAMKGKSIKGGGKGRRPRPATTETRQPRSLVQRIGDSFRRKRVDEDEADEGNEGEEAESTSRGFARSGSMPARKKRKKSAIGVAWQVVVEVAKILVLVLLLRAYVVQVSEVQGPSMEPTLLEKDRLVVERITPLFASHKDSFWTKLFPAFMRPELSRGDIVVVRSPEDPGLELVKRLIAMPGDTLKFQDGQILLKPYGENDFAPLPEDYIKVEDLMNPDGTYRSYSSGDLGQYIREGEELVVPHNRLFVMGDNRNRSNDSRRWLNISVTATDPPGLDRLWVHTTSVEGVVLFRLWPFDRVWPPVK